MKSVVEEGFRDYEEVRKSEGSVVCGWVAQEEVGEVVGEPFFVGG